MEIHVGVTGWQLVARVVFLIRGTDRLFRPTGGRGFSGKCGVSKLYPSPPQKKRLVFLIQGLKQGADRGVRGFLESVAN